MLIQNVNNGASAIPQPAAGGAGSAPPAAAASAAGNVQAPPPSTSQPSDAQLQKAVDNINNTLLQANKDLQFSIDQSSHKTVVKVVDTKTGDEITQFPSKATIAIAQSIDVAIQKGLLVKQKA